MCCHLRCGHDSSWVCCHHRDLFDMEGNKVKEPHECKNYFTMRDQYQQALAEEVM